MRRSPRSRASPSTPTRRCASCAACPSLGADGLAGHAHDPRAGADAQRLAEAQRSRARRRRAAGRAWRLALLRAVVGSRSTARWTWPRRSRCAVLARRAARPAQTRALVAPRPRLPHLGASRCSSGGARRAQPALRPLRRLSRSCTLPSAPRRCRCCAALPSLLPSCRSSIAGGSSRERCCASRTSPTATPARRAGAARCRAGGRAG